MQDDRHTAETARETQTPRRPGGEALVALACFLVLCAAVLGHATKLLEPDDYAYRASIVALSEGHITLSGPQFQDLAARLRQADGGTGMGIVQWTQLPDGRWTSEKNPGYPWFAVAFDGLGLIRLAPLFYGALGCLGLFVGARRWLGPWGGVWAVGLFCSSGAAMAFAWRPWMPTFTGAALLAAGAGALLWAVLADDAGARRRTAVGLFGFLALEGATLIRYTDAVFLAVAIVTVVLVSRLAPGRVPRRALVWWLGSVVLTVLLVLGFDWAVYGSAFSTGYASGVVSFGLGAVGGNLARMPRHLTTVMPAFWLALAGLVWIVARSVRLRRSAPPGEARPSRAAAHRDLAVAASLAAAWLANWGLYATYYWTAQMSAVVPGGPGGPGSGPAAGDPGSGAIHLVRFFVPALAPIALLGAWPLARLPRWIAGAAIATFFGLGLWAFADMAATDARGALPPGGRGMPPVGAPPGATGAPSPPAQQP